KIPSSTAPAPSTAHLGQVGDSSVIKRCILSALLKSSASGCSDPSRDVNILNIRPLRSLI
ncbi:MAG: hypothetical protein P8Z37_19130, partial [Acidobacteriota bacterium]